MNCDRAQPLVPLYLDGELSEIQADELRPHLLSCPSCRAAMQAERSLSAWFVPTAPVAVPDGFAARVARRAFAGDPGVLQPASAGPAGLETPILQFALRALAAAAVVLIVFAIAIRRVDLPESDLKANDEGPISFEDHKELLRDLNETESRAEQAVAEDAEDGEPR